MAFMPTHPWAQTYINLGLGNNVTRFNITLMEPFNQTSNGTICLPHVTLPDDMMASVKEGDLASIQIIQLSHTGGALYNVFPSLFPQFPGIRKWCETDCCGGGDAVRRYRVLVQCFRAESGGVFQLHRRGRPAVGLCWDYYL